MAESTLLQSGDGHWLLEGEMGFDTVPALLKSSANRLLASRTVEVDLKGVTRADSAGLALLLEWQRAAGRAGKVVTFTHVPEQLLAIARLCGLDEILAF